MSGTVTVLPFGRWNVLIPVMLLFACGRSAWPAAGPEKKDPGDAVTRPQGTESDFRINLDTPKPDML